VIDGYKQRRTRQLFRYKLSPASVNRELARPEMLKARKDAVKSAWVFPGDSPHTAILGTSLDHRHDDARAALKLPKDFVIHSLRHTMLTRLGEAGADAFTIMRIAGHSSVTVSQRYVHPTPEGMERAFGRLENLNAVKFEQAEAEAKAEAVGARRVGTDLGTVKGAAPCESAQGVEFKKKGP
jgi:integrase